MGISSLPDQLIRAHYNYHICIHVHIYSYLVGPLPLSGSYRYLLTVVDRFTRWPEAFPIADITAKTVCQAFYRNWFPRFGVPDEVVTDQGAQFLSSSWKEMMRTLGVKCNNTTAYHPQANGLVERILGS